MTAELYTLFRICCVWYGGAVLLELVLLAGLFVVYMKRMKRTWNSGSCFPISFCPRRKGQRGKPRVNGEQ